MNYGIRVKFVTFGVLAVMILVVLYNTMVNRVSGDATEYRADFTSVSGLRVGDDVRAAGVRVGRVNSIDLVDGVLARVTFVIGDDQPLTDTTRISVRYQNLLGQRYLSLLPGDEEGTVLAHDAVVPTSRTDPGFDLTALLNGFEPLFATLEPAAVNELAGSIVAVLQGEAGTVESLLTETAALTQDLAAKDEVIGEVLTRLTPVLENLAARDAEFSSTVDELAALMTGLAQERTTISGSIDGIAELSAATADLVTEVRPDAAVAVSSLRQVADALVENSAEFDELFTKVPRGTGAFARPMANGTWLNLYICALGLEVLPGPTIPVGHPQGPYSEVCR